MVVVKLITRISAFEGHLFVKNFFLLFLTINYILVTILNGWHRIYLFKVNQYVADYQSQFGAIFVT